MVMLVFKDSKIHPATLSLGPLGQLMTGGKVSGIPQGGPSARNRMPVQATEAVPSVLAAFSLWIKEKNGFLF